MLLCSEGVEQTVRNGIGVLAVNARTRLARDLPRPVEVPRQQALKRGSLVHKIGLRDHDRPVVLARQQEIPGDDIGTALDGAGYLGVPVEDRRKPGRRTQPVGDGNRHPPLHGGHVLKELGQQAEALPGILVQLLGGVGPLDKEDVTVGFGESLVTARRGGVELEDDRDVRLHGVARLFGPGPGFQIFGQENLRHDPLVNGRGFADVPCA